MSLLTRGLAAAFFSLLTGCFSTYLHDARFEPGPRHDEWRSFFFWGLAGHAEIDVHEFCPGEVREVAVGTNFGTWAVSFITLGIYSPQKIYVTCAAEQRTVVVDARPSPADTRMSAKVAQ
jgi:hypothetical protein